MLSPWRGGAPLHRVQSDYDSCTEHIRTSSTTHLRPAPSPGAHVAQHGSRPPPSSIPSYDYSDERSTSSSFGPPPPPASYASTPPRPMSSPPGPYGSPSLALPSEPDWRSSSGQSDVIKAYSISPGEVLSTLDKLQQLDLYTDTDTSDAAHQLDAEVVAAEVTYTITNTQASCSEGGE